MQHVSLLALFIALVVLVLASAFFAAAETSMMALNRYRIRHLAKSKNRRAARVNHLLNRPDRLLGVVLIGNTFADNIAAAIATLIGIRLFGDYGVAMATVLLTLVMLVFGDVAPKTFAALNAQRIAFKVALPLFILLKLFYPLVWLVNSLSNGLLRLCGVKLKTSALDQLSSEELRTVVLEAGSRIPAEHQSMLLGILDLEKMTVDDIMVPPNDIIGINLQEDWDTLLQQLLQSSHGWLPIYEEDINKTQGMLQLRKVLHLLSQNKLTKSTLVQLAEEPYFIPEGTPLNQQLLNFRNNKRHNGMVVDEYGDIQGLVTLQDILDEVVGEFTSNFASIRKVVVPEVDGSYLVDGSVNIRDLNRSLGWRFNTSGPKTLSGIIVEYLESLPHPGTTVLISGYPVDIVRVHGNMVKTARVHPHLRKITDESD
ncbi:CNNM domain-containing protein [soil metagenome]